MLATQIQRCSGGSLRVTVRKPWSGLKSSRYSKLMEHIQRTMKLIRRRRNQVTRLEVHLACWSFKKIVGFDWPNLEEFVWNDTCAKSSHCGSSQDGGLPRLRDLSIRGGFNWPLAAARHLKTLRLRETMDLELAVFARFLRRNTSLQYLDLTYVNILKTFSYRQEEPIKLPYLNELQVRINDGTCGRALALLRLPSLKRLSVISEARQGFLSHSPLSEFCSQLSITSLEGGYCVPPRGNATITVVGSNELGTRSLCFEEFPFPGMSTTLFRSLSIPSLASVTSFSFGNEIPEGIMSSQQILAICDLLKHLSRVERMSLSPSRLAVGIVRRLRNDSELCPRLRVLGIIVTPEIRETAANLVVEMLKSRASGGDKWEMSGKPTLCWSTTDWKSGGGLRFQMVWEKGNSGKVQVKSPSDAAIVS
jgi:hypothetical protein